MSRKSNQQSAVSIQRYRAKGNITLLAENVIVPAGELLPQDLSAERIQSLVALGLIEEVSDSQPVVSNPSSASDEPVEEKQEPEGD